MNSCKATFIVFGFLKAKQTQYFGTVNKLKSTMYQTKVMQALFVCSLEKCYPNFITFHFHYIFKIFNVQHFKKKKIFGDKDKLEFA